MLVEGSERLLVALRCLEAVRAEAGEHVEADRVEHTESTRQVR